MDISQMTEEEQLQAAMQLSLEEAGGAKTEGSPAAPRSVPTPGRPRPRTFPNKDPQDVLSPPCRASAKKKRGEPRTEGSEVEMDGEIAELLRLLFGDSPEAADVERWLSVGFQWSQRAGLEWGLWQKQGGPCGVFAPVQAFIVKQLLFGESEPTVERQKEQPMATSGADDEDARAPVLAHALSSILFHCCPSSSYTVCQVRPRAESEGEAAAMAAAAPAVIAAGEGAGALAITARKLSRAAEVRLLLEAGADSWLAGPFGVLSFLCSVLATRGPSSVREDMDDPSTPLIGRFGHCSQELVNLMLIGEATSNVFDGTRWLGDDPSSGFLVRGVDSERVGLPQIGFLSELEPMRYLSVGLLYKNPDFPIWVLGSPTHYTMIFSANRSDSQLSDEASLEQQIRKVFVENSIDEGGLAMSSSLSKMLEALGIAAKMLPEAQREMVREDVILWEDFRRWTSGQFDVKTSAEQAASKIKLFLYDGQDPPGPTLKSVLVEVSDIDPTLAAGGSEGDAFVATLHTRWPDAAVLVSDLG
eukprot:s2346_g10.t1